MFIKISSYIAPLIQYALHTLLFTEHIHGCHISEGLKKEMRKALVWDAGEKVWSANEVVTEDALPLSPRPPHLDHSFFHISNPPHYWPLIPPNSLILELKGKFSSFRISPYMPHSSQTLPHTGLSHSAFPLRSTLKSHGLSILQECSNRSLQSQTNCYSYQVLGISSWPWPPGALPTRALTSTGSWVWCLLQSPIASHRSFMLPLAISTSPPSHHTKTCCACHLLSPQNWRSTSYGIQKPGWEFAWKGAWQKGKPDVQQPCLCYGKGGFHNQRCKVCSSREQTLLLEKLGYLLCSLKSNSVPYILQAAPTYLDHQVSSIKVRKYLLFYNSKCTICLKPEGNLPQSKDVYQ